MIGRWLGPVPDAALTGAVLAAIALGWVVLLVRAVGLRAFSKMTSFDFVTTVAMGSLVAGASQSQSWPAFAQTLAAMAALFAIQVIAAWSRRRSDVVDRVLQNRPVVLMRDGVFRDDAMAANRIDRAAVVAKLREANVLHLGEVRAVVLETTGDISVLHGEMLDPELLSGVDERQV